MTRKGLGCVILVCVMSLFVFSSCVDTPTTHKLEYGFGPPKGLHSGNFCGVRSDTNQFDIDNVTLDFYFGSSYCDDNNVESAISIPEFDIYFCDKDGYMLYLVRHVEENYISNKYRAYVEHNLETDEAKLVYNYHESITMPAELFSADKGVLGFRLGGVNILVEDSRYDTITGRWIYYKSDGKRVTLSNYEF